MLNHSFHTLVTELGSGLQCTATLRLRTSLTDSEPQALSGIGFSPDGLAARFAAEGEVLERATWQYGALWNSVYFPKVSATFPEETRLILSAKHRERLYEKNGTAIPLYDEKDTENNPSLWCPAEVVFFFPKLAQDINIHAVTTGWAYHLSKEQAAGQGYREVIERDLQMLFWLGRLKPYLEKIPEKKLQPWLVAYAYPKGDMPFSVLQMAVSISERFGGIAYFTLIIYQGEEQPYLTVGSALKTTAQHAFQAAMGECLMMRWHQHEQLLSDIHQAPKTSYTTHVISATRETVMRDKTVDLYSEDVSTDSLEEPRLNYSRYPYYIAYLQPPPVTPYGYVAKVWVEGCQGMLPIGIPYGVTTRWQEDWGINKQEWEENRWHPYP